jgi:chromosome partitioning protein
MAKRIVVASQKGGSGKTTVCLNLAVALAEQRRRTLLVDLDPQGGIGHSLAKGETEWLGLAEYLMKQVPREDAVIETKLPGLSVVPRGRLDARDTMEFEKAIHAPGVLRAALDELDEGFDYTIVDTPSGLGMISRAALASADYLLAPLQAQTLAIRTITQLLRVVEHVRETDNPRLELLGFLPTMVEIQALESLDVMTTAWSTLANVLDTTVPLSSTFATASHEGLPVAFLGGRLRPEARRFEYLAIELETRMNALTGGEDEQPRRELV